MFIFNLLWSLFCFLSFIIGSVSLATFFFYLFVQQLAMRFPRNLKKAYSAQWALVTGASSGIGKAIAEKLAQQEINVVLVALDDPLLNTTFIELQKKYPTRTFRKVGVNLGDEGMMKYMSPIIEATKDIEIDLVFNNAGFLCAGLLTDTKIEKIRANVECNAGCCVPITQHFLCKMIERKHKGLITFTSSAAAYLPGPTATTYSCTKAFLTNFAASLAAEVRDVGIDVVVIHPSPVNTNFYKHQGPALSALTSARKLAVGPMEIADQIFSAAGRLTIWDHGLISVGIRLLNKLVDFAVLVELIVRFGYLSGDHQALVKSSKYRLSRNK